ncbi:MAG: hypothetical protein ACHQ2E_05005 [Gemmatimonadales bacterium]
MKAEGALQDSLAVAVLAGVLLLLAGPVRATAQDSTLAPATPASTAAAAYPASSDSARRYIKPMSAFWRSLLIPGWGQAKLGRRLSGGIFIGVEGLALGMVVNTTVTLNYYESINSGKVDQLKQQQQDWIVILVANHLLSAMEAYVSSHLWDFPGDLQVQALPHGASATLSLPIPGL